LIIKLRKITKSIYKSVINNFFLIFYGKIRLNNKSKAKIFFVKKNKIFSEKDYKYKIYEFTNSRVYTDCVENVSVIHNNFLYPESSFQQINGKLAKPSSNQILKTGTPKYLKKIDGNMLILAQGASGGNYSHWLLDILPKLKLASLQYNLNKIDYFYFSKLNSFQLQILKLIGINKNKFIDAEKNKHCFSKKIIFISHPNYFKGTISEAHSNMPKWIIRYLRKKFLKFIKKNKKTYKKIYIDRSDSAFNHCKLINNYEIETFLKSKGFKILKLGELSFLNQITIFNNAKFIVGAHGAGFANLIFCKKNTKVLEIKPHNHPGKGYQRISNINKLNYKLLKLKKIKNHKYGDMILKIKELKKYI